MLVGRVQAPGRARQGVRGDASTPRRHQAQTTGTGGTEMDDGIDRQALRAVLVDQLLRQAYATGVVRRQSRPAPRKRPPWRKPLYRPWYEQR